MEATLVNIRHQQLYKLHVFMWFIECFSVGSAWSSPPLIDFVDLRFPLAAFETQSELPVELGIQRWSLSHHWLAEKRKTKPFAVNGWSDSWHSEVTAGLSLPLCFGMLECCFKHIKCLSFNTTLMTGSLKNMACSELK